MAVNEPAARALLPDLTLVLKVDPVVAPARTRRPARPHRGRGPRAAAARRGRLRRARAPLPCSASCASTASLPRPGRRPGRRQQRPEARGASRRPSPPCGPRLRLAPAADARARGRCSLTSPARPGPKAYVRRRPARGARATPTCWPDPRASASRASRVELGAALVAACGGCGALRRMRALRPRHAPRPRRDRARGRHHPHRADRRGHRRPRAQALRRRTPRVGDPRARVPQRRRRQQAASRASKSRPPTCTSSWSSDRLERVLPTIVSRCQLVEFRPVADAELHRLPGRARRPRRRARRRSSRACRTARSSAPRAWRRTTRGPRPPRRSYLRLAAGIALHDRDAEPAPSSTKFGNVSSGRRRDQDGRGRHASARAAPSSKRAVPGRPRACLAPEAARCAASREQARLARLAALDALDLPAAFCATCGRSARRRRLPSRTATG